MKIKKVKVLDLRPTQFAVGMLEVEEKIEIVKGYSKKKMRAYIKESAVPIVVSPDGDYFITDKHHFLCVCYHLGVKKVHVTIVKDFSHKEMSYRDFWKWMLSNRSAYPYCQFGEGPREALYLPRDIRGLADDPYRSLAWFVRKSGAFENSDRNFAEFTWANFFRKRGLLDEAGPRGMTEALVAAVKLAQSPAAKKLPGYDKLNIAEKVQVIRKAKQKGKQVAAKI